jgi:signal transduction histidine kinase
VAALGGRIWARPRDGGGAAVGFALPVAADAAEAVETATAG